MEGPSEGPLEREGEVPNIYWGYILAMPLMYMGGMSIRKEEGFERC